jgi:26S proteasome regulatory subunit T2
LKQERIKDYLILEEGEEDTAVIRHCCWLALTNFHLSEFITNQTRLMPGIGAAVEDRNAEDRGKVDQLRGSPMMIGTLEEIIDDDHAIISTSGGGENYVSIMSFVDKDLLEPGCSVLLNNKSHAVIGVLADDADPMVNVMKLEKAPTESYADIGGLEQQIQEIKVCHIRFASMCCESDQLFSYLTGIGRTPLDSSGTVRRDGYQTTEGCHSVWCSWNR